VFRRRVLFRRIGVVLPVLAAAALLVYAVVPWLPLSRKARPPRTIVLYGFSILGDALNRGVFPEFQKDWRTRTGETVELISSFAGSGTVTNQILMGVPAEVALLSLELDALKLAAAGVVAKDSWKTLPHAGVVNRTPFVILVRRGNPRNIRDFRDLAAPGVRVVHPDPLTSGGANWAIVAEYGAGFRTPGGGPRGGYDMLLGVWKNVVAQAASARAARTQFENGFGDALVTYEQEALFDRSRGKLKSDIVYPRSTVYSEHTLVRIERNIPRRDRDLVEAFVQYLWSDRAQAAFSKYGFRSVDEGRNAGFTRIEDGFGISDFGGWPRAKKEIVDGVWKARVLKELGK
jgi:sulfate/thiosulfate transport system substrate-binding protein